MLWVSYWNDCDVYDDLLNTINTQISNTKMRAAREFMWSSTTSSISQEQINQATYYNSKYWNELRSLEKEYNDTLAKKNDCITNIDLNQTYNYTDTNYTSNQKSSSDLDLYNKYYKEQSYYYDLSKSEKDTEKRIEYEIKAFDAVKNAKKYAPSKDYDIVENIERVISALIWADYCSLNDFDNSFKYFNYSLLMKEDSKIRDYLNYCKDKSIKKENSVDKSKQSDTEIDKNFTSSSSWDICSKSTTYTLEAIHWMYENWMTIYDDWEWFRPNYNITREEASKFFVQFYSKEFDKWLNSNPNNPFNDIDNADPSLKNYILNANYFWLINWFNWNFMPFNQIKQAQAIAILVRMYKWYHDVEWPIWYKDYLDIAENDGWLCDEQIFNDPDYYNITRWSIARLLYNLHKYLN